MKTYQAKPSDVTRKWYLIDASTASLGRISTVIADLLTGKRKPMFTSHIDCGDFVVVINSDNLKVTGNKLEDKKYYYHSSYPGGLRTVSLSEQLDKDSTKVLYKAVYGMLPTNKLREERLKRLKIYPTADHKHQAQTPEVFTIKENK